MKQYFYNERTHRLHIKGYCKESKILPYHVRWFDTYDEALPLMVAALDCVDHVRSMKTN